MIEVRFAGYEDKAPYFSGNLHDFFRQVGMGENDRQEIMRGLRNTGVSSTYRYTITNAGVDVPSVRLDRRWGGQL